MRTISSIFLLLIFIIIYCCKSNEKFKQGLINLENVSAENIKISTIADSIYYIKLETSNECLIKNIQKIYVDKELIFILDNNERLLLFDRDGKFLNQIGRIGKGPGEYSINDFSVDSVNNIVYILDARQILGYNYSGEFINIQISVNRCVNLFYNNNFFYCYTPSELCFSNSSNEYNIHVLDSTGSKVNSFLPVPNIKREIPMFVSTGQFYSLGNEVFLLEQSSNKIYTLGINGISIKYEFINGSNKDIEKNKDQNGTDDNNKMACYRVFENKKYFLMNYDFGSVQNCVFIDKKFNSFSNIKTKDNIIGFEDDITGGLPISPEHIFDNMLIDIIQPSEIIESNHDYDKIYNLTNLSMDDNPVLSVCLVKKGTG